MSANDKAPAVKWGRLDDGFIARGRHIDLIVRPVTDPPHAFLARAYVRGFPVHYSEHHSRDQAMRSAERAGIRAARLRRFEEDPPEAPNGVAVKVARS